MKNSMEMSREGMNEGKITGVNFTCIFGAKAKKLFGQKFEAFNGNSNCPNMALSAKVVN